MSTAKSATYRKPRLAILPILIAMVVTYCLALLIDHLYMVNGRSYPLALAESITVPSNGDRGISGFMNICGGKGGWEFYEKDNGLFMRCKTIITGSLTWPKTYRIDNYDQLADEALIP